MIFYFCAASLEMQKDFIYLCKKLHTIPWQRPFGRSYRIISLHSLTDTLLCFRRGTQIIQRVSKCQEWLAVILTSFIIAKLPLQAGQSKQTSEV